MLAGLSMVLVVIAIATILFALRLERKTSHSMHVLSQAMEQLAQGNFGARVEQGPGGGALLLQHEFNRMANALQNRQNALQQRIDLTTLELEAKTAEAENNIQKKSNFLASVSHDLRQPMHAIGLFTDTLKHRVTTPAQQDLVQRIEDSVSTLQTMFDGLLNISRMESGMIEPNLKPCNLAALLQRVGLEFKPLATQKGLSLRIHVCPAWVNSDSVLLGRLLNKLVANAIRYTDHGGVLLACRRRQGRWVVQIWDTGIGMAAEHLPKIFEAHYQVGNAERNSAQGVGLGLAIVSGIARLLDYKIEVYSRPARGSVFSIILPLTDSLQFNRRGSDRQIGQFNGERVLVVEDDRAARESLQGLLASWGLDAIAASDFTQASCSVEKRPTLIICDYRLPQKSGVDTIAALRDQLKTDVPAVLISGDTVPDSVAIMQASGLPILYKPVRPAKLRALIASLLMCE